MGQVRTKKTIKFCHLYRWDLSFRNDWAPHGEANAKILSETWIDKMQWICDICTNAQDPAYMFQEDDFTSYVEPPAFASMMDAASEFTQARGWLVRNLRPAFVCMRVRLLTATGNGQ